MPLCMIFSAQPCAEQETISRKNGKYYFWTCVLLLVTSSFVPSERRPVCGNKLAIDTFISYLTYGAICRSLMDAPTEAFSHSRAASYVETTSPKSLLLLTAI